MLYGVQTGPSGDYPLTSKHLKNCEVNFSKATGEPIVNLEFNAEGAKIWEQMTARAARNSSREIAIILNEKVVSAPRVMNLITNGKASISGNFSKQEALDISNQIQLSIYPHEIVMLSANTY